MKKKYFQISQAYLFLLLIAVGILSSCRNDYLPDHHEIYSNKSRFQLTSKKISLSESRHKAQLAPMLDKAEAGIKRMNKTPDGETDVSIDTDNVLYIENGPDYHTYTFSIVRENAGKDAPVENLVLSPLPDGSYKEFLIAYHLSEQEKNSILSGISIPLKGKTRVWDAGNGILGKQSCGYETVDVYIPCATGEHHAGNVGSWGSCQWEKEGFAGPQYYSLVAYVCTGDPDNPGNPGSGSGGGGSSGSSGDNGAGNVPPCEIAPPLSPKPGLTDENGCPIGIPTQPNLPDPNDPCVRIKNITNNTTGLKNKINSLNTKENLELNYEKGATIADNAQGQSVLTPKDGNPGETFITVYTPPTGEQTGFIHTHFEGSTMLPVFSFEDLAAFDAIHFYRKTNNKSLDKLTLIVISKAGVFAMVIENSTLFYNMGGKIMTNREYMRNKFNGDLREKVNVTYGEVIKQVAKVLPEYGVSLYKATDDQLNSWNKMVYNPVTGIIDEVPCN